MANPEIESRIAQYELAFRMQTSVPELMNFDDEPQHVLDRYGVKGMDGSFAANCLLARRLAERGTRFIHLYHRGWDHHGDLDRYMKICCGLCDHPSATLVKDLKERGMLDDTLVIWGGEFGRTPMFQGKAPLRARSPHAGLLHVDGRKAASRAASPMVRRTSWATMRPSIVPTSATFTPPCCIS